MQNLIPFTNLRIYSILFIVHQLKAFVGEIDVLLLYEFVFCSIQICVNMLVYILHDDLKSWVDGDITILILLNR